MEYKYDRQKHNKTYYEKNKENIKRKQREKRLKMKEALQQIEAENQETENEPKPEPPMSTKSFFDHFRYCKKYVVQSCHQWLTGCVAGCISCCQKNYRTEINQIRASYTNFIESIRLTMLINNISNILNIIKFILYIYNYINAS